MKHIKKYKLFEETEIKDEDITVGKLIEELSKFDSGLIVRVGCHGYEHQEIVQIIEKDEYDTDNDKSYRILQINGNGSWAQ